MLRRHRYLALFTLAYMVGFGALAYKSGNSEFLFYGLVMVALIAVVMIADSRVRFAMGVLWALSFWGFLHMAGGNVPLPEGAPRPEGTSAVLYNRWILVGLLKYDQLTHAYGFGVATVACWQGLETAVNKRLTMSAGLAILTVSIGMGLGAMNEVVEFLATRMMPETNVGGYINTGYDLIANLVGCVIAVVVLGVSPPRRRRMA
ncbi:MAG: DUF2238 domain-containing protein [Phycisphaeraceae bacterium]|nr:DUF2238 domain-containing protein [Phycisphaeraceae bacterium]MCB9848734.1 DUF2238 domain-containing protein [Phycisphaeraceae bacterium]